MKKVFLAILVLVFSTVIKSQPLFNENALIKSMYGMEKRELIARHVQINAEKSDLFWQFYEEYEIDRKEIGDKRTSNIMTYAKKYDRLSAQEAESLVKASIEVQLGFARLWERTYIKMSKSISPVTIAQFIQAEMYIENMVRQELALEIPLIGEFDISK